MEDSPKTERIDRKKLENPSASEPFSEDQISEIADLFSDKESEEPGEDDTGKFPAIREEDMKPTED